MMNVRRSRLAACGWCALLAGSSGACADDAPEPEREPAPSGFHVALDDTAQYFTAPLRWDLEDWAYFGGTLVVIEGAHAFDGRVRAHFAKGPDNGLNGGRDKNSLTDALPTLAIIAGTGLSAAWVVSSDGLHETLRLVEAGVFGTVTAEALTYAAGRKRPDATTNANTWRAGGDSFPSVHATAAFAVGMTFAESGNDDYRWLRRIIGYGVAAGTAYVRVKDDLHWASDTVAGAALGMATARFVLNRENGPHANLSFAPQKGGWMVSYLVPLR